jgi:hypothetical protein
VKESKSGRSPNQRSARTRKRRHGDRRRPVTIKRDIMQLRAWAKNNTRLRMAVHGEFGPAYVGQIAEKFVPKFMGSAFFEFKGLGVTVLLLPESWSRSELTTPGEESVLDVYGKRGRPGLTISELSRHGPGTANFRAVLDQLTDWSKLRTKLAIYMFLGPCARAFVSEVNADDKGGLTFYENGSCWVVDITKYDLMTVEDQDQRTKITLFCYDADTMLQISNVPPNEAEVLERLRRCGFISTYLM